MPAHSVTKTSGQSFQFNPDVATELAGGVGDPHSYVDASTHNVYIPKQAKVAINPTPGFADNWYSIDAPYLRDLLVSDWQLIPFSAGDYVGVGGTWTVSGAELRYCIIGKRAFVHFKTSGATSGVAGVPSSTISTSPSGEVSPFADSSPCS